MQIIEVLICSGLACTYNNSLKLKIAFENEIMKHGLQGLVKIQSTGCKGLCSGGPIVIIKPDNIIYHDLTEQDVPYIIQEHFIEGHPVNRLLFVPTDFGMEWSF